MFIQQVFVEGLAHASYVLSSGGEAAVIDPRRDVDIYLDIARREGFRITKVLETHLHADFISGHLELASQAGAEVFMPAAGKAEFKHTPLKEGDDVDVGSLKIRVLATPGHTPDCLCFTVADTSRSPEPWVIFTGDTLFVGDVGRPDLFGEEKSRELAGELYRSLAKLKGLPDFAEVYPAHGAGSLCGRAIGAKRSSTIGFERRFNWALNAPSEEAFAEELLREMPPAPAHFHRSSDVNRKGPKILGGLPGRKPMSVREARELLKGEYLLLDVRSPYAFGGAHIEGAYNIDLAPQLSVWAGWVIPFGRPLLLMLEEERDLEPVVRRLIRVGHDDIVGYVEGGMEAWLQAGYPVTHLHQLSVHDLEHKLREGGDLQLVDVRTDHEWLAGHIEGAVHIPAGAIKDRSEELERDRPTVLICGSGYRSNIASSILQRRGFERIWSVAGGMLAWGGAGYPTVTLLEPLSKG